MAEYVDQLARDIISSAASDKNYLLAIRWVNSRYREIVSRVKFRHLRKVGELTVEGVIDTGTVDVTRGSTSVSGTSTTFETDISSGDQEYYWFRTLTNWYKIASITSDTALTLDTAFAEATVSDGSYKIIRKHHVVASTARWVGDFYLPRLRYRITKVHLDTLDFKFPARTICNHYPNYVAEVGVDSNNYGTYEFYPIPENAELVTYIYWELPSSLTVSSTIPPVIDAYTLKEGAMIDFYRYRKMEEIQKGNVEAAAVLANEEQKSTTRWEKRIKDAIRTSRGSDDMSLILNLYPDLPSRVGDQRTARDYVFDNWNRG